MTGSAGLSSDPAADRRATRSTSLASPEREVRCDFTDLIVAQCAHCTGRTAKDHPSRHGREEASCPPQGGHDAPHTCLSCGGSISPGQPEERVPIAKGPSKGSARYRHTRLQDCQAALAQPPGGNTALIGRYRELAPVRLVSSRRAVT